MHSKLLLRLFFALLPLSSSFAYETYCIRTAVVNRLCVYAALDKSGQWAIFTVQSAIKGWVALGVGSAMTGADIVVAWKNQTGGNSISDRFASTRAMPVFDQTQDAREAPLIIPQQAWAQFSVGWRRPLDAMNSAEDRAITRASSVNFIWAFSATFPSDPNDPAGNFPSHTSANVGTFSFNFFPANGTLIDLGKLPTPGAESYLPNVRGTVTTSSKAPSATAGSSSAKVSNAVPAVSTEPDYTYDADGPILSNIDYEVVMLIHGLLMFVAWNIFAVGGVFAARYFRQVKWWFPAHWMFMFIGTGGATVAGFIIVILYKVPPHFSSDSPHGLLGLVIVCLMVVQFVIGLVSHLTYNPRRRSVPFQDVLHALVGVSLILLMIPQTILGIFEYAPNALEWVIGYGAGVFLVLCILIALEIRVHHYAKSWAHGGPTSHSPEFVDSDFPDPDRTLTKPVRGTQSSPSNFIHDDMKRRAPFDRSMNDTPMRVFGHSEEDLSGATLGRTTTKGSTSSQSGTIPR